MLQQAKPMPKLQEWHDRLEGLIEETRASLRDVTPARLALRSGCERGADDELRLAFLGREYAVTPGDLRVRRVDTGEEPPGFVQSLLLTYLATADGTTPSARWIGFRELPSGLFYAQAFQGYSGGRLVRELQGGLEAFRCAAVSLGGEPLEEGLGDAGYAFVVLPRVRLAVTYWEGDDEFLAQAQVLFEDSASHYMPTDGLAILGSQLVGRILRATR